MMKLGIGEGDCGDGDGFEEDGGENWVEVVMVVVDVRRKEMDMEVLKERRISGVECGVGRQPN